MATGMDSSFVTPQQETEPDRYPNKLMIDRARFLVLTMKYNFRKEEYILNKHSPLDYEDIRNGFIEHFGYEDTLEYILINTIILERLGFRDLTNTRLKEVVEKFDVKIPDIKHLKTFLETYKKLSNSIASKSFKQNLDKICNDKSEIPEILKDVYWTLEEMELMLELLVKDPRNETDVNALIVFISMHGGLKGGKTVLYDCKMKPIEVNRILHKFGVQSIQNNDNLCSLLFLSACRGDRDNDEEAVTVFVQDSDSKFLRENAVQGWNSLSEGNEGARINSSQRGSGDMTSEGVENTDRSSENVDQEVSGDTASKGLGKKACAGDDADQGGSIDTISEKVENTDPAKGNVDHEGCGNKTGEDLETTDCVEGNADQENEFRNPPLGQIDPPLSNEEMLQEDLARESLLPETVGSCPNNCLVAYSATLGFKSGGYDKFGIGTLFIHEFVYSMSEYESVALLPFLTLLLKRLVKQVEMPVFDHRLTKMPVLRKQKQKNEDDN